MKKILCRVKRTTENVVAGIYRTVIFHDQEIYQALQWGKAIYGCMKLLFPQFPNLLDLL